MTVITIYLNLAFAVPQQLTQQGRLIDGTGVPIDGANFKSMTMR